MKRVILLSFVSLSIVAAIVFSSLTCSSLEHPQGNVTARVKNGSLNNIQLTLILTNDSDRTYYYGNPFRIERRTWRGWVELEITNDVLWTLPAFHLYPNSEVEVTRNFSNVYGTLEPGRYRIIKEYFYVHDWGEWGEAADTEHFIAYAEFRVR